MDERPESPTFADNVRETASGQARGRLGRLRTSSLMMWRRRAEAAEELLIAPPDLRAHDPSFADEIAADTFGLANSMASLRGRSPFAIEPPNPEWEQELHGFGWLRHMTAARSVEIEDLARRLAAEWIADNRRQRMPAWLPQVTARRVISWLSHAALLLDGAEHRPYAAILRSLDEQVTYLSTAWRTALDGQPRLLSLIALVTADLCIAGRNKQLSHSMGLLCAELDRQVLPDGGHVGRNPATLIDLMLDLLPLRQCFGARAIVPDPRLTAAINRMAPMLRTLLMGDGMPARFNGVGYTEPDALATALAYADGPLVTPSSNPPSGYLRLAQGETIIVMDVGTPPALDMAADAGAGCLAIEMSAGGDLLLTNAGRPAMFDPRARALTRSTSSHNTLCLNDQSSSELVRNARLEQEFGAAPIRHPDTVTSEAREGPDGAIVEASHDGYVARHGLTHTRKLRVDPTGTCVDGLDILSAVKGASRPAWELPFSIHFHLHPEAETYIGQTPDTAELALDTGEHWRLSVRGAALAIEDSTHYADVTGARPARQIVLHARCGGTCEVAWRLERVRKGRPIDPKARWRLRAEKRRAEAESL